MPLISELKMRLNCVPRELEVGLKFLLLFPPDVTELYWGLVFLGPLEAFVFRL